MRRIPSRVLTALAAACAVTVMATAEPPAKVALTGGRIIPIAGDEIESGTVLIENGRIKGVSDVDVPYDAMEVDCSGMVIMPGMIDAHTQTGLDIANENLPVAPFLDVYDAIDPSRLAFEDALRDGVTSMHVIQAQNCVIGGVSRVVQPIGLDIRAMTQAGDLALKMSTSPKRGYDRMRQMAELRETFYELDHYLERLAERQYEESMKEKEEDVDVGPEEARRLGRELIEDEDYDDKHRNLVRLRRGELEAWIYCGRATDVGPALAIAEEQGFTDHTVLVLGGHALKAIKELRRAKRPVVLPADLTWRERDPITGELEETFLPEVARDAGLTFAILPNRDASMAERYLNYQAAVCVRNGIPRDDALAAITINPARMLGIDDRYGSIEEGKNANLTILSGDPLDFESWVEMVYIDGMLAYERSGDPRLQRLLNLTSRVQAAAAERAAAEAEAEAEAEDAGETDDAEAGDEASGAEGEDDGEGEGEGDDGGADEGGADDGGKDGGA